MRGAGLGLESNNNSNNDNNTSYPPSDDVPLGPNDSWRDAVHGAGLGLEYLDLLRDMFIGIVRGPLLGAPSL